MFVDKTSKKLVKMDKGDVLILSMVVTNPRVTLKKMCVKLKKSGIAMSPEGVRKRLDILMEKISLVPTVNWREFGLELIIVSMKVVGGRNAKKRMLEKSKKTGCFLYFETFGAADAIAFFIVRNSADIPGIVDSLKEIKEIKSVNYSLVSKQQHFNSNLFRNLA